jgi:hypothetical protein
MARKAGVEGRIAKLRAGWEEFAFVDATNDAAREAARERLRARVTLARDLIARFPTQFRPSPTWGDFFHFGPEIAPGWIPIFVRLVADVQLELDKASELGRRFRWTQVKEKYAEMRAYWQLAGRRRRLIADLQLGRSRMRLEPSPRGTLEQRIAELVHAAELEASRTCETCGSQPARIYRFGWWTNLCTQHYHERKARDREARRQAIPLRLKHRAARLEWRAASKQPSKGEAK